MNKEELFKTIDNLPQDKLGELIGYVNKLSKENTVSKEEFKNISDVAFSNYDKALRNLVER